MRICVHTVSILISLKTEIARSVRGQNHKGPCRRRNGGEPYLVLTNFGDVITAEHKVLKYNCESRNSMDPGVSVQTKTSQGTQGSLQKFLEPDRKPKVIYTDNSMEFGKACEDLSWNHCTSTPHRSETDGIAERAVRRVKKPPLLYCCNQV